jgi:hypothetical protein
MSKKYPSFENMVDTCDTQLFLTVPALCILYDMEAIVMRFAPTLIGRLPEISKDIRQMGEYGFKKLEEDLLEIN